MAAETILFRARVPARRLKKVEKILDQLGLKSGDAFNLSVIRARFRSSPR